jgi:hypothetical protein
MIKNLMSADYKTVQFGVPKGVVINSQQELFDYYNRHSPYPVTEDYFIFQREVVGYTGRVGKPKSEAKKLIRFLKKSDRFVLGHVGNFEERHYDIFRWGL